MVTIYTVQCSLCLISLGCINPYFFEFNLYHLYLYFMMNLFLIANLSYKYHGRLWRLVTDISIDLHSERNCHKSRFGDFRMKSLEIDGVAEHCTTSRGNHQIIYVCNKFFSTDGRFGRNTNYTITNMLPYIIRNNLPLINFSFQGLVQNAENRTFATFFTSVLLFVLVCAYCS